MEIKGYKCFNKNLINRYGKKFEVGKIYISSGVLKFGNNGFHMCKNIEDTFRYFDAFNNDVDVCLVSGSGKIIEYSDEYYGYYDMYCVEKIKIIDNLSREEIINIGLDLNKERVKRFVSLFRLTNDEIFLFKEKFEKYVEVLDAISYYQEGNTKIYKKV